MISSKSIVVLSLLVLWASAHSVAWTSKGHVALTGTVFAALEDKERDYYWRLSESLRHRELNALPPAERWHYLSQMPDRLRDLPLERVFARYGARLPQLLDDLSEADTANWHYHNNLASADSRRCEFRNYGRLLEILRRLDEALKTELDKAQETLVLAFLLHLLQDLHQPLHTMTKLDGACRSDRGGNLTCVKAQSKNVCDLNLHYLWDSGFERFVVLSENSARVPHRAQAFEPELWALETLPLQSEIYRFDSKNYKAFAAEVVDRQLTRAYLRQLHYVQAHWRRKHHEN